METLKRNSYYINEINNLSKLDTDLLINMSEGIYHDQIEEVINEILERKEEMLDQEIEDMIAARQAARKEKNFKLADEIRDTLLQKGIILEDTREGVKWKRA